MYLWLWKTPAEPRAPSTSPHAEGDRPSRCDPQDTRVALREVRRTCPNRLPAQTQNCPPSHFSKCDGGLSQQAQLTPHCGTNAPPQELTESHAKVVGFRRKSDLDFVPYGPRLQSRPATRRPEARLPSPSPPPGCPDLRKPGPRSHPRRPCHTWGARPRTGSGAPAW